MTLRFFPSSRHRFAKAAVLFLILLGVVLGVIVGEYDDAPGAVAIFPLVIYVISMSVYNVLSWATAGRTNIA